MCDTSWNILDNIWYVWHLLKYISALNNKSDYCSLPLVLPPSYTLTERFVPTTEKLILEEASPENYSNSKGQFFRGEMVLIYIL